MKTIKIMKRLMGCAAAILALTACSESEDLLAAYHSDSKAVHITAQVGKASADGFTRSNPMGTAEEQAKFNENDEISVKADGQDAVTYKLVGSEWQPQGQQVPEMGKGDDEFHRLLSCFVQWNHHPAYGIHQPRIACCRRLHELYWQCNKFR